MVTFCVSGFIGLGSLFTDLWYANRYPVPTFLSNQSYCQVFLGLLFVAIVMLWLWYAFLNPPKFGRLNPAGCPD